MRVEVPARITYAQEKLIEIIKKRELRSWCQKNGLDHAVMYYVAVGQRAITYRTISATCHIIAPIEWLYFTDEKLPYEPTLLPTEWNYREPSKYVLEHKFDYKTIAKKYNMAASTAYNIFVMNISFPSVAFIRQACAEVNPVEFFTSTDNLPEEEYIASRGDLVSITSTLINKKLLVLSSQKYNASVKGGTGCLITDTDTNIPLLAKNAEGFVDCTHIESFDAGSKVTLIERLDSAFVYDVLQKVKANIAQMLE